MSLAYSFFVQDREQARGEAAAAAGLATWLELRLDQAPELDFAALVAELPLPVIAACPRRAEGGHFDGGEEQRAARLREAAQGGARYVDLPLGSPRPAGLPATTRVVHSWHEPAGTSSDLRLQLHRIEERLEPGDVAKVVAWAEDHASAMRCRALYGTTRAPLVSFAQGPGGRASRAWAPVFGAPWTYVRGVGGATAPGQWGLRELVALWPPGGASPTTALCAVAGNPIGHSRSPLLWNTAFRLCGLNAFYLALEPRSFQGFLDLHRDRHFLGFSITAPFKEEALAAADQADPAAQAVGAANTLQLTATGWKAYATDGPAALDALEAAGLGRGAAVLVVGAGGAAKAAVHEAIRRGHAVTVTARRPEAAAELAAKRGCTAVELARLRLDQYDAVLQATPVGSEPVPGNLLAGRSLRPGALVLDMVYAPLRTALLVQAREHGAVAVPGYQMLVRQMRAQFRLLTGREAPLAPLQSALEADLGARP